MTHANGVVRRSSRPTLGVDVSHLESLCRGLLLAIGEDPTREGLRDTPARWARMWREFVEYDPGTTDTTFEAVTTDQLVVVSGMRVWSFCEHHLLPFWCDVTVGYLASERVLGLSKFARIAHQHAHRLQVQERLVHDIARDVSALVRSDNVAVLGSGRHLCMEMRGILTPGTMHTSLLWGVFRTKPEARAELLALVGAD